MATSALSPIVSDDEKAYWLICDATRTESELSIFEFDMPSAFDTNSGILIGATESGTTVTIAHPSDTTTSKSVTIEQPGEVRLISVSYSSSKVLVSSTSPYVVVSITPQPDRSQALESNAKLSIFNNTTNNAGIGPGDYYVLAIGGGGGGGGSAGRQPGPFPGIAAYGGGGGSGGVVAQKITINATTNNVTVGGPGPGGPGNNYGGGSNSGNATPGGAGGTTSFSGVSAPGGGGGATGSFSGNTTTTGAGGPSPLGAVGGSRSNPPAVGHLGFESPYTNTYFNGATTASGSGGSFYRGPQPQPSTPPGNQVFGNVGSSSYRDLNLNPISGTRGGGGEGGVVYRPVPDNNSFYGYPGVPGATGAVYVLKIG